MNILKVSTVLIDQLYVKFEEIEPLFNPDHGIAQDKLTAIQKKYLFLKPREKVMVKTELIKKNLNQDYKKEKEVISAPGPEIDLQVLEMVQCQRIDRQNSGTEDPANLKSGSIRRDGALVNFGLKDALRSFVHKIQQSQGDKLHGVISPIENCQFPPNLIPNDAIDEESQSSVSNRSKEKDHDKSDGSEDSNRDDKIMAQAKVPKKSYKKSQTQNINLSIGNLKNSRFTDNNINKVKMIPVPQNPNKTS